MAAAEVRGHRCHVAGVRRHGALRLPDGSARHLARRRRPSSTPRTGTSISARFSDSLALRGIRFTGRATGRNRMEWPLGRFSAGLHGDGAGGGPAAGGRAGARPHRCQRSDERRGAAGQGVGTICGASPDRPRPDRRGVHLHVRSRLGPDRAQPLRHAQDLRRVPGPHGVGRAVEYPVPRDERRLAGERPPSRRDHDGLRLRHGRSGRRGMGRVRRRDDEGVPRAARGGPLQRRAHASMGRGVGRRLRGHRHRERLRHG